MNTKPSKSHLQAFIFGQIMASAINFKLKNEYELSPLEQSILLLADMYQKQGYRVTGPLLTRSNLAHQRNTQEAIKELVNKGFIEKKKVERRLGLCIILKSKGFAFVNHSHSLVRQQYKILTSEL